MPIFPHTALGGLEADCNYWAEVAVNKNMLAFILGVALQAAPFSAAAAQAMLADLNATRAHAGLPALALDPRLSQVAAEHGLDMAQKNYFEHDSPGGETPFDRMREASAPFSYAGENLALAPNERIAYRALLESPPHLRNILQAHFTRVGIAAVRKSDGEMVFVQDFTD